MLEDLMLESGFNISLLVEGTMRTEGIRERVRLFYQKSGFSPPPHRQKISGVMRWGEIKTPSRKFQISDETDSLIQEIADELGESRAEVLEFVVRSGAVREGIKLLCQSRSKKP
jgi:hypothetical protein